MTKVIAFHGHPGSADLLRRDMGDPEWVDVFFEGHDLDEAVELVNSEDKVILVGYSFGGDLIACMTCHCRNIVGAVLYESPLLKPVIPKGNFPVCMIWNRFGRQSWPASVRSSQAWCKQGRPFVDLEGRGGHVRFTWRWPFLGHAWDQRLNSEIERFVQYAASLGQT